MQWTSAELDELKRRTGCSAINLNTRIFVTREHNTETTSKMATGSDEKAMNDGVTPCIDSEALKSSLESDLGSSNFKATHLNSQRSSLEDVVSGFNKTRASFDYQMRVIASGPAGWDMI
jgi:hypothetical protein